MYLNKKNNEVKSCYEHGLNDFDTMYLKRKTLTEEITFSVLREIKQKQSHFSLTWYPRTKSSIFTLLWNIVEKKTTTSTFINNQWTLG